MVKHNQSLEDLAQDQHWYIDDEMNRLLSHYVGSDPDVEYLSALLILGEESSLSEQEKINEVYRRESFLQYKKARAQGANKKNKVFLPVNLGKAHWALLYIIYDDPTKAPSIFYFDPLGKPIPEELVALIDQKDFFPNVQIESVGQRLQNDSYNCGPWVIEAARALVNGALPEFGYDISQARFDHACILHPGLVSREISDLASHENNPSAFSVAQNNANKSYKKAEAFSNSYRGDEYQKTVAMKYALEVYCQTQDDFQLYTEQAGDGEELVYGKFDDIRLETPEKTQIIQVKYAGSREEARRVYTLDMLCGTEEVSEKDRKKKAWLHVYYDSWRKFRESEKAVGKDKKAVEFIFYTNHALDKTLGPFFNGERLTGLLEDYSDPVLKEAQKKLIESFYQGSRYFRASRAAELVESLVFDTGSKSCDYQKFVDAHINKIVKVLKNKNKTFKATNLSDSVYLGLCYLLISCFDYNVKKKQITIPQNYLTLAFDEKVLNFPIRAYFREKLRKHVVGFKIDGHEIAIFNATSSEETFKKISSKSSPVNIVFQPNSPVCVAVKDEQACVWLRFLSGKDVSDFPCNAIPLDMKEQLIGLLRSTPGLPFRVFDGATTSIDPSVRDFISEFSFRLERPGLDHLERELSVQVSEHFKIDDLTHYREFQEFFLQEFRSPEGHVINREGLREHFERARDHVNRQRLVGRVEGYVKKIKGAKKSVVEKKVLEAWTEKLDQYPIIVISGEKGVGKSFTAMAWVNYLKTNKHKIDGCLISEDNYAFLPLKDLWQSDIKIFGDVLKFLVVDDVVLSNTSSGMLSHLISISKKNKAKLVFLVDDAVKQSVIDFLSKQDEFVDDEASKDDSLVRMSDQSFVVQCKRLSPGQIIEFTGVGEDGFFEYLTFYIQLKKLFKENAGSGLAIAMSNPCFLHEMSQMGCFVSNPRQKAGDHFTKKLDSKKEQKKRAEGGIYITPHICARSYVNFVAYSQAVESGPIFVCVGEDSLDPKVYFEKDGAYKMILADDFFKVEDPSDTGKKTKKIPVLDCRGRRNLMGHEKEKINNQKGVIVLVSPAIVGLDDFEECCEMPGEDGFSRVIRKKTVVSTDVWRQEVEEEHHPDIFVKRSRLPVRGLISVDAGMGKSTMVAKVAAREWVRRLSLSRYHHVISLCLDQISQKDSELSLEEFLTQELRNQYRALLEDDYEFPDWFKHSFFYDIHSGNVLLLLDGGDQVGHEQLTACRSLYDQLLGYSHVFLFTRPDQAPFSFSANRFVDLKPFNEAQVKAFFSQVFSKPNNPFLDVAMCFFKKTPELQKMLGVPLQCYLFWSAWEPYYLDWVKQKEDVDFKQLAGEAALIGLFKHFIESRFLIFFSRNLKLLGRFSEQRARVMGLSASYLERLAHVAAFEHFQGITVSQNFSLPEPEAIQWLDEDLQGSALVKRLAVPMVGQVRYVFAHKTYQEYLAAKFFVEGLLKLRQVFRDQHEWAVHVLLQARFMNKYQQFWIFVYQWLKHHLKEGLLPPASFKTFPDLFKSPKDLIVGLEAEYWGAVEKGGKFPEAYHPGDSFFQTPVSSRESLESVFSSKRTLKVFHDFEDLKGAILRYRGAQYTSHGSDVYRAIRDLPNHSDVSLKDRLDLLEHALRPNKIFHGSFRVHEGISKTLSELGLNDGGVLRLLLNYFDSAITVADGPIYNETRSYVLSVLGVVNVTVDNISILKKFVELMAAKKGSLAFEEFRCAVLFFTSSFLTDKENLSSLFLSVFNRGLPNVSETHLVKVVDLIKNLLAYTEENSFKWDLKKVIEKSPVELGVVFVLCGREMLKYGEVASLFQKSVNSIDKNRVSAFVQLLEKLSLDSSLFLHRWLGFKDVLPLSDSQNFIENLQELIDQAVFEKSMQWSGIDGGIPGACQTRKSFNVILAAYLLQAMRDKYWQVPHALAAHIPFLLAREGIENSVLVLRVYRQCLETVVIPQDKKTIFFDHEFSAVHAIKYAWRVFQNDSLEDAAAIVWTLGYHLHWPLFKAGNRLLTIVSPVTGDVVDLEAAAEEKITGIYNFFGGYREELSNKKSSDKSFEPEKFVLI